MTGTSVKDVSGLMNYFNQTKVPSEKTKDDGFSAVLSNTTAENQKSTTPAAKPAASRGDKPTAGESLKEKEITSVGKSRVKESVAAKPSFSEEEEAAEMLGAGIVQLLETLSELFGMSEKEITDVMEQLGIAETKFFNHESLSSLVLELGGAQDSLAFLTNGDLYEKYTAVSEQLDGLLTEVKENFHMEDTQLAEMIEGLQNSEQETLEVSIPVEITVEETKEPEASHKPLKQESSEEEVALEKPKLVENPRTTEKPSANEERQEAKQGREDGNQTAFAQSLKPTEMHQAQAAEGAERVSVWDADTQNIMRQIMDYMKVQVKQGVSNLEMQLHPASLGTVQIQLVSKGGAVSAHFITENEAVKATLESQLVQLKESFAEQGVRVEAVEVSVQTHQFERNLDQGRGRQQEDSKKTKNGRIRMTGAAMAEEEEELPAEEMQINGSTVNYTA